MMDFNRQLHRLKNEAAFALVTLMWLAGIGLLSSAVLAGILLSRYRALEDSRRSLEQAVALKELFERIESSPDIIPKDWSTQKDSTYWVGEPAHDFQVSCRRWGLWAVVDILDGNSGEPIARRVVAGSRIPAPDVVAYIRTNRLPVVIADEAKIHGILAVADSIIVRPWKGRLFRGPRPSYLRNVETFTPEDVWEGLSENIDKWINDPDLMPDGYALLAGPAILRNPPPKETDTIIVLGDLELMGDWDGHPVCICVRGNVTISSGSRFVGQLIAEGKIEIDGAHLEWPSLVVASSEKISSSPVLCLNGGTLLEGAMVVVPSRRTATSYPQTEIAHALIGPASKVFGAVYITGALQMKGTVEGWVEVGETLEQIESATYHNWILSGTWRPYPRGQKYPLFPIGLSNGSYTSAVLEGLR